MQAKTGLVEVRRSCRSQVQYSKTANTALQNTILLELCVLAEFQNTK